MSISVLPQLLEVDSELLAQTSTLEAQLNELREKRKGIQTVIAMFESGASLEIADIAKVTELKPLEKAPEKTTERATAKTTENAAAAPSKATKTAAKTTAQRATKRKTKATKATKVKATRGRPAKAKVAKPAEVETATQAKDTDKATAKRSGRTANWQRYVQENYRKAPLPDVIVGVLQAQPGSVFKIADVMNAVFKEDMPKNYFLKARNRVSNILSAGARNGDWYRGRGGTYSVSEKAVKSAG